MFTKSNIASCINIFLTKFAHKQFHRIPFARDCNIKLSLKNLKLDVYVLNFILYSICCLNLFQVYESAAAMGSKGKVNQQKATLKSTSKVNHSKLTSQLDSVHGHRGMKVFSNFSIGYQTF